MTITLRLFLLAWSALWTLGLPIILFYLWRRARKDPAYLGHLSERFGRYPKPMPGGVWIHAVSLGELRSAVPLIRTLLARGENIVITHFTPAGRSESERVFAEEIRQGRLQAVWVPFETEWAYRGFFRAYQPVLGLVMEIEIWPRMVFSAKKHSVPLFMCNAQYPRNSLVRDSRGLRLRQQVMQGFTGALVKSEVQAKRFADSGVKNISVTGELRFDQPVPTAQVQSGIAARTWLGATDRRVVCIASAIEGEDAIFLEAIQRLITHTEQTGDATPLFVYVPRRPERFDEVAEILAQSGLSLLRRSELWASLDPSEWGQAPDCPDILLGDSLGEMYAYLAMADDVVVGGGFSPKGSHNISEALMLGKPVLTGPYVQLIEYPFYEAEAAGVARSVQDGEALGAALINSEYADRDHILKFVASHSNATSRTICKLERYLS